MKRRSPWRLATSAGRRFRDPRRVQQRLQPRRQRDEDAEAEEHETAHGAHRREPPQRSRGTPLDRRMLIARVPRAAQHDRQRQRRNDGEDGLHYKQPLELAVAAERRSEQ
jgi:hypothetical protein